MLKTKICDNKIEIRGLGFKINITCDCGDRLINFSNYINTGFEINRRIVFVIRLVGMGRNTLEVFCLHNIKF